MRNFYKLVMTLVLMFTVMFFMNFIVMYVLFGVNVINPVDRTDLKGAAKIQQEDFNAGNPSADGADGKYGSDAGASPDSVVDALVQSTPEPAGGDTGVLGQGAGNGGDKAAYYMTSGEVSFLENLSLKDKLEALSVISKIGREEADKIYDMASDGVTVAEMEEIRNILEKYLSKQDMDTLDGILARSKMQYAGQNIR